MKQKNALDVAIKTLRVKKPAADVIRRLMNGTSTAPSAAVQAASRSIIQTPTKAPIPRTVNPFYPVEMRWNWQAASLRSAKRNREKEFSRFFMIVLDLFDGLTNKGR